MAARATTAKKAVSAPVAPAPRTRTRKTTAPAPAPVAETAKPAARRRPATKTTAPAKPAPKVEPVAETSENSAEATVKGLAKLIATGALDEFLILIDDAISDRLNAVEKEAKKTAAAKKTPARTTTKSAEISEKLAPVSRTAKKPVESASAKTEAPSHVVGRAYVIKGTRYDGAKVTLVELIADEKVRGGFKAKCALREDFTDAQGTTRAKGKGVGVLLGSLITPQAAARLGK